MQVEPTVLEGRTLRLEPLDLDHAPALWEVAEPDIFKYGVIEPEDSSLEAFKRYIQKSLAMPGRFPFAIVLKEMGQAIGTSSYLDIRPEHRGLEIGYTWIGRAHQGTQVNPECKYLMLRHAFETLGAIRVQLKTDSRNLQSQRAMEKLGAQREGVLRNQMILPNGYFRHSVLYSIIEEEWPQVKSNLEARLGYVP